MISTPPRRFGLRPWSPLDTDPGPGWLKEVDESGAPLLFLTRLEACAESHDALVEEELLQARSYRHDADRARFLTGRLLVRRLLSAHLACHPRDLDLRRDALGKPYLPGPDTPQFNLSHSGLHVLAAFHPRWPVGVDIEQHREIGDWLAIARHTLPDSALAHCTNAKPDRIISVFFSQWTRWEARLKAFGSAHQAGKSPSAPQVATLIAPAGYSAACAWIAGQPSPEHSPQK